MNRVLFFAVLLVVVGQIVDWKMELGNGPGRRVAVICICILVFVWILASCVWENARGLRAKWCGLLRASCFFGCRDEAIALFEDLAESCNKQPV